LPTTLVVCCGVLLGGCSKHHVENPSTPAGNRAVVAEIDGEPVTAAELVSDIANRSPYYRLQFRSADGQKQLLDTLIGFEVMAKEARDRGYDRDPEVVRTMKQQMINKLVQNESQSTTDEVPDAEIQQYYASHGKEFLRPERVRVSQIFIGDGTRARIAAQAALALRSSDEQGFRALVARFSEDPVSTARGGDIGAFDREARNLPRTVIEASFKMSTVGEVSGPIETEKGSYILRLTERTPASTKPLSEVRDQIQGRLASERRATRIDEWSAKLRSTHKVRLFEDKLKDVDLTPPQAAPSR
jgi:peptidyl-prolyl cis-trans isomerase C